MKLKGIIEFMTLSTSLYALSKDEKLMADIKDLTSKGTENLDALIHEFSKNEYDEYDIDEDKKIVNSMLLKAGEIKKEFDSKVEEIAEKVYAKMHIAHANDLEILNTEIKGLRAELLEKEKRISILESKIKQ